MIKEGQLTDEEMQAIEQLRDIAWNTLQQRIQHDEKLATSYREFRNFYIRKFISVSRSDEEKAMLFELMETTVNIQFYHGYVVALGIIQDILKSDELLRDMLKSSINKPEGELRNQIGALMKVWLAEISDRWYVNEEVTPNNRVILRDYPTLFDTYQNALMEIANYGAFHALIFSDFYTPFNFPKHGTESFILGHPYDLNFLNPQVFMKAQYISTQHEIWDVFSILNEDEHESWLGTIHFSAISSGVKETDVYYVLSITLMKNIQEGERHELIMYVIEKIPEQIRSLVQIRIIVAEEMDVVTFSNNEKNK